MKKLSFLLSVVFLFIFCVPAWAAGREVAVSDFSVDAKAAVLMEAKTGTVLYANNAEAAYAPASVTKIMTLLLIMEALAQGRFSLSDTVTVSAYAASMGGSQVFLKEGEKMSAEDLLKCTVIASANDAAVALAELVMGSEEAFVAAMNKRAGELGMKSSHFENVTGLDDTVSNHVCSAMDIAIMSAELIKHEQILTYSSLWQDSIRDGAFTLTNTNRLVRYYEGCNGLKTGSTAKAGYCVSATAKRGNMQLIAVVMGAEDRDARNKAARALLDFGFSGYALYEDPACALESAPVQGGTVDFVMLQSRGFSKVVDKSVLSNIEKTFELPEKVKAPLQSGDTVGRVVYRLGDTVLGESLVCVDEDVEKISFFGLFGKILMFLLTGK